MVPFGAPLAGQMARLIAGGSPRISSEGRAYHMSTFYTALLRGQRKAKARGHVVRPMRAISVREAEEIGRRQCGRCLG